MFAVVALVKIGACKRGFVHAGAVHETIREARISTGDGARVYANEGVAGTDAATQILARNKALQGFAQMRDGGVVNMFDLRKGGSGIVKLGWGYEY